MSGRLTEGALRSLLEKDKKSDFEEIDKIFKNESDLGNVRSIVANYDFENDPEMDEKSVKDSVLQFEQTQGPGSRFNGMNQFKWFPTTPAMEVYQEYCYVFGNH